MKKLIVFDLDGTLAESKSSLDSEMSGLLHDLLAVVKVAVISGGDWSKFEKQFVSSLPHDERLLNLSLLPTSGPKFYRYDSAGWKRSTQKISLQRKEPKSSVLSRRRSELQTSKSKRSGESKLKTGEAR